MKKYKHSEITPEQIYNKRRKFIKSIGLHIRISLLIITIMSLGLEKVILSKIHKNLLLNLGVLLLKVK